MIGLNNEIESKPNNLKPQSAYLVEAFQLFNRIDWKDCEKGL